MKKLYLVTLALSLCVAISACNSQRPSRPHVGATPASPSSQPLTKGDAGVAPTSAPAQLADARTTLTYLASDQLEGRGVGTRGLDLAADYIANQFTAAGLKTIPSQRDMFQPFEMTKASEIGPKTTLSTKDRTFEPKKDFIPLSFSKEGSFKGPVIFAGYGIASDEYKYNDYASFDVQDKVVLAMRFEPHDEKGKSRFTGDDWSSEAHFKTKVKQAADRGAAALLLVTPPGHHEDESLMPFARLMGESRKIPVLQIKLAVADELLRRGGAPDLKTLQEKIDASKQPASFALSDVKVEGNVDIQRKLASVKNVIAYLPGTGPRANEYIVVGAHYDHIGRGGINSLTPTTRAIHYGADDNASGTAALIQIAVKLAKHEPLERSIIFAAFTAVEEGILGSDHFVKHPPVPLSDIVAMVNLDMVGRIRPERSSTTTTTRAAAATKPAQDVLYVGGHGTAEAFDAIVRKADADSPLQLKDMGKGGLGPSDHMAFGQKKIPVLFFFSGLHPDYHRPTDTADKINFKGIDQTVDITVDVIEEIARLPRQQYVSKFDSQSHTVTGSPTRSRVTLGIVPDYSSSEETSGAKISGTSPGSPADKAGLKEGDVIVQFNKDEIENLYDLSAALAKAKPGDKVKLKLKRGTETIETDATLAERK